VPKTDGKRPRRRQDKSTNGLESRPPVITAEAAALPAAAEVMSPPAVDDDDFTNLPPEMFINRELSWLDFNDRVLFEADEATNPLLERVKFAAIFSSNLDEFFMIRVAGIKRKIAAGIATPGPDGRTPIQQLQAVREQTQGSLNRQAEIITRELLPGLAAQDIAIVPFAELSQRQQEALTLRFEEEIFPILTPQAIDRGRRFPHVSNGSLNLIAALEIPEGSRYARVKIPATLPRFIPVPDSATSDNGSGRAVFTWLEDVVAANLPRLFVGTKVLASYPFHVTRDSDIELDDEDDPDQLDLMNTMRESIARRAFGPVVRLMVDVQMPDEVRHWLVDQLHASDQDVYVVDGPLDGADLMDMIAIDRPDLKFFPFTPSPVPG